jgi:hypothetical protein
MSYVIEFVFNDLLCAISKRYSYLGGWRLERKRKRQGRMLTLYRQLPRIIYIYLYFQLSRTNHITVNCSSIHVCAYDIQSKILCVMFLIREMYVLVCYSNFNSSQKRYRQFIHQYKLTPGNLI